MRWLDEAGDLVGQGLAHKARARTSPLGIPVHSTLSGTRLPQRPRLVEAMNGCLAGKIRRPAHRHLSPATPARVIASSQGHVVG